MSRLLLVVAIFTCSAFAQDLVRNGEDFSATVTRVRSIAPGETIHGFLGLPIGHSISLYAIDVASDHFSYVAYCTKKAPQAGDTYTVTDFYVAGKYTDLRLSPTDVKDIPNAKKKRGQMYRALLLTSPAPEHGYLCDIYSITRTLP